MRVLIFGATGTAGGSVLDVCLASSLVTDVAAITRRPLDRRHPKLRAVTHDDFSDFSALRDTLSGLNACFYCLGVSAMQVSDEPAYRRITHDLALSAAAAVKASSPGAIFHFISGHGAALDARAMWARVKAETERDLRELTGAVCWRPGYIDAPPSHTAPRIYRWIRPVSRLLTVVPALYIRGDEIGRAMIQATQDGLRDRAIENVEIRRLAARARV